jgi:hypothetical protein
MAKIATYYNAGRLSGDEADLFMFTCWNVSRTTCGCHSVYESGLNANISALQKRGYEVLHAIEEDRRTSGRR